MKTYTVQYQRTTSDGVRNIKVQAQSARDAEDMVRTQENSVDGRSVIILRSMEEQVATRAQFTTTSFRKVQTPNLPFKTS